MPLCNFLVFPLICYFPGPSRTAAGLGPCANPLPNGVWIPCIYCPVAGGVRSLFYGFDVLASIVPPSQSPLAVLPRLLLRSRVFTPSLSPPFCNITDSDFFGFGTSRPGRFEQHLRSDVNPSGRVANLAVNPPCSSFCGLSNLVLNSTVTFPVPLI